MESEKQLSAAQLDTAKKLSTPLPVTDEQQDVLEDLKDGINTVFQAHDPLYEKVLAFSIVFDDDETGAKRDQDTMSDLCRSFGYPDLKRISIPAGDPHPRHMVQDFERELARKLAFDAVPTLVIGHFSGHGFLRVNNSKAGTAAVPISDTQLCFQAREGTPSIPFKACFPDLLDDESIGHVNFLMIIDCCHAAEIPADFYSKDRTIEVVFAVREDQVAMGHPTPDPNISEGNGPSNTFTKSLVHRLTLLLSRGETKISMIDVISEMKADLAPSASRSPGYCKLHGEHPIKIPILAQRPSGTQSAGSQRLRRQLSSSGSTFDQTLQASLTPSFGVSVVMKVHAKGLMNERQKADELKEWLSELPPTFDAELLGAYRTQSLVLYVRVPWSWWVVYGESNGNYELLDEVYGHNLLEPPMKLSEETGAAAFAKEKPITKSPKKKSSVVSLRRTQSNIPRLSSSPTASASRPQPGSSGHSSSGKGNENKPPFRR